MQGNKQEEVKLLLKAEGSSKTKEDLLHQNVGLVALVHNDSKRESLEVENPFSRGQGRGRREVRCYRCGKLEHMAYDCPKNRESSQRNFVVAPVEEVEA